MLATLWAAPGETAPPRTSLAPVVSSHALAAKTQADGSIRLTNQWHTITLFPNARRTLFNGLTLFMNGEFNATNKDMTVTHIDLRDVLLPLLESRQPAASLTNAIVILDPGHGGTDTGTQSAKGVAEKGLVLDISRRVQRHLKATNITARLTREDDRFIPLPQRAALAKTWDGDLFVSIHLNASTSPSARGVETFVVPSHGFPSTSNGTRGGAKLTGNGNDVGNGLLAYHLHQQVLKSTGAPDRGIRRARFDVLNQAHCPAVLIECGFLSHPQEARSLKTEAYREKIAVGIAAGIISYLRKPAAATEPSTNRDGPRPPTDATSETPAKAPILATTP